MGKAIASFLGVDTLHMGRSAQSAAGTYGEISLFQEVSIPPYNENEFKLMQSKYGAAKWTILQSKYGAEKYARRRGRGYYCGFAIADSTQLIAWARITVSEKEKGVRCEKRASYEYFWLLNIVPWIERSPALCSFL